MDLPPANPEFDQILARAQNGDRAALDQLLTRLEPRFRMDAERRVGAALRGRTRVSDVLQDAYIEVVRAIGSFKGGTEANFYAWVTTIIENAARMQHRFLTAKQRKAPSRTTEFNALTLAYLRTVSSPLSDLQDAEGLALVHRAVQQLRDEHREVIEAIILADRPVDEVATEIGRTEAATRMLLSRARAALAIKLDQLDRPDADPA